VASPLGAVGRLQRRHIQIDQVKPIGKESNSLEDVESGLMPSTLDVHTEDPDPGRDEWETKTRPALRRIPLSKIIKMSGLSRRMRINAGLGRARPHRRNRELLAEILTCRVAGTRQS
jgi:hypothetical protein